MFSTVNYVYPMEKANQANGTLQGVWKHVNFAKIELCQNRLHVILLILEGQRQEELTARPLPRSPVPPSLRPPVHPRARASVRSPACSLIHTFARPSAPPLSIVCPPERVRPPVRAPARSPARARSRARSPRRSRPSPAPSRSSSASLTRRLIRLLGRPPARSSTFRPLAHSFARPPVHSPSTIFVFLFLKKDITFH